MGGKKEDENGCGEGSIRKSSPVTEKERVRSLGKEVSIHNSGSTCHLDSYLK